MDDNRWQIAKRIFPKALALPPERRTAWIEAECDDEGVRLELLELLAAHDDIATPGVAQGPRDIPPVDDAGVTIDRYKLLQKIGEGGFGTVYMAAQTEPVERRVALKIIKAGMDTGQVIARFEAERQALALMDHPNIAKVLDAGTTASGKPYFVMELVKGIPITEYCDQQQLGPKRRLELFIRVCHGVQHAHQKGIIHRDLKPNNVLVAEYDHTAVPKIIDFGVAKATNQRLTAKTVFTEFGQLVGTFEYMSPEQAKLNQLDIDTRSDVYALGVLMYELLTGSTPLSREQLRSAAFDDLLRIIREEEPPKPSTRVSTMATAHAACPGDPRKLSRLLRGDLDWIVMRALDKERNRRYESAGSLAEDVARHLGGEAVQAGPPSAGYKLRKFVRRHRGAVLAGSALLLMLVLGLGGTSFGLVEARAAERVAVDAREAEAAARRAERHLTFGMAMDRGLALCDEGNVGHGLLWLARALEIAPADETAGQRVIRANLNAWRSQLNVLEMVYPHEGPVIAVAFSPAGDVLATGSADDTAQLWDVRSGARLRRPLRHDADLHELAFSADGARLLTTALDTTAFLWDARTGEKLLAFRNDRASPERRLSGGTLGGAFRHPHDVQVITSYGDGPVTIWDAATGEALGWLPTPEHMDHDVVVSEDGSRLLVACHGGFAQLWDLDTRALLATFSHGSNARVATAGFVGADESRVVTGSGDGTVYLWSVADALASENHTLEASKGEFARTWRHGGSVHRLRVDGERILTASFDTTARLWSPDGSSGAPFEHHAAVQGVAFHPDGSRVATACDDDLARLWRPAPGVTVRRDRRAVGVQEAVYSADGRFVLTKPDPETALVSHTATGAPHCELRHPGPGIRAMAVNRDGSRVLTGGADGTPRLWDVATGDLVREPDRRGRDIWSVAFSPDGTHTLVGDFGGTVEIRDVKTGDLVGVPFATGARVQCIAVGPGGTRIAIAGDDRLVRIYDGIDRSAPRLLSGHGSTVGTVAFSADGTRLVTGSFDNTARVWDAATGMPLSHSMSQSGPIAFAAVAFSRDGRTVVSGCENRVARVWDTATSRPIGPALRHDTGVRMTAFVGDSQVVTGTAAGTVSFWSIATSPLQGDTERIRLWIEVATGFELDDEGALAPLDAKSWKQRRVRLEAAGGVPAR